MNGTLTRHTDNLGAYWTVKREDGTKAGSIEEGRLGGMVARDRNGHVIRRYTCASKLSPEQVADELIRLTDPHACTTHRHTEPVATIEQAREALSSPEARAAACDLFGDMPGVSQCCARGAVARFLYRAAMREATAGE
jgi:hypothetical protein